MLYVLFLIDSLAWLRKYFMSELMEALDTCNSRAISPRLKPHFYYLESPPFQMLRSLPPSVIIGSITRKTCYHKPSHTLYPMDVLLDRLQTQ
jgi:hypothetical protein